MKKKLLSMLLCAVMLLTTLPIAVVFVSAVDTTCDHKNASWAVSGENKKMTCSCGTLTFQPTATIPTTAGNYYLTADITQTDIAKVSTANAEIHFDLNGHTVTNTGTNTNGMLSIQAVGVSYSIYDSVGTGVYKNTVTADQIGIKFVSTNSTVNLYGGTLEGWGSKMTSGGAVSLSKEGGVFNMFGGTIQNCAAWQGGAFYVASTATLNIYDGKIIGCTAVKWNDTDGGGGAAIRAGSNANVNIFGGEFKDNVATNSEMFLFATGGTGAFKIMGGTFYERPDASLIAEGYGLVQNGSRWTVQTKTDWLKSGASIRFSNPTGIRFTASIPKESVVGNATYGMLIAPTEYVNSVSEFTKEALDRYLLFGTKYVEINSSSEGFKVDTSGDHYTFSGVLTGLEDTTMQLSAIAYVRTESGEYIYSDYDSIENSRNIAVVAGRALNDQTVDYTNAQKEILRTLAQADTVSGREDLYLVWNEEFIGKDWDNTMWATSSMPTSQASDVTESADDKHIYIDENGNLVLKVLRENSNDTPFSLPYHMSTANSMNWQYGYLEVRAKIPMGSGVFPSLFTLQKDEYKTDGYHAEIDIFECMSSSTGVTANAHLWQNGSTHVATMNGTDFHDKISISDPDAFHTFGFYWDQEKIEIYIDGVKYREVAISASSFQNGNSGSVPSNAADIINNPMYLMIGNPIYTTGKGVPEEWETPETTGVKNPNDYAVGDTVSEYVIEYVRLYQNADGILHTNK